MHLREGYPLITRPQALASSSAANDIERPPGTGPVDIFTCRNWIEKCDKIHKDHCHGSTTEAHGRPSKLVDCQRQCLVPAEDHQYLALSYVWGPGKPRTRTQLEKEGALRPDSLPKTIAQAMELVVLLGQRYLWVDRLCIDQDDDDPEKKTQKKAQIAAMADIYANSYLTIIAAEGTDASEPLCRRGFSSSTNNDINTQQPPSAQNTAPGKRPRSASRDEIIQEVAFSILTSAWSSRGWTFQEYYSSRRKLFFHNDTVAWECHCAAWHETERGVVTRQCQTTVLTSTMGFDLSPWPDFHQFVRLVCLFNIRHLTYQSDVLDAIDGLLSVFSTVFEGGFVSGLPVMMFDAALLWQPYFPMERRKLQNGDTVGSSWSYFGHSGSMHSEDILCGCNFVVQEDKDMCLPATHTVSTVSWTHSDDSSDSKGTTPIIVSAARYRERYKGKHEDLPPGGGWHADASTRYFWHRRLKRMPGRRFWYPVPVIDESQPIRSSRSRFIHGLTHVVTTSGLQLVAVYPQRGKDEKGERCADGLLRTSDGKWVGYVRLNKAVKEIKEETVEEGDCHLVELSRGSTGYDERLLDRYVEYLYPDMAISRDEVYEFVNVMWVEQKWGQGFVERKGVGRVIKAAWARMPKTDVKITIG
ncbi:heterokaryon incompatibility protein-domain-containing protein [Apodospora peruviana]|uniref:Heterokaryon incompatibility protein-domain-containing protein n=1 Tax=Apodospora peruviana TaxID=516989 RepID=A0AAE0IPF6_9PEZI|nr:heterokaryon incompatibility protein-domain-containing protein [Apodospora peruviana]